MLQVDTSTDRLCNAIIGDQLTALHVQHSQLRTSLDHGGQSTVSESGAVVDVDFLHDHTHFGRVVAESSSQVLERLVDVCARVVDHDRGPQDRVIPHCVVPVATHLGREI